jgi:hypothetical protein
MVNPEWGYWPRFWSRQRPSAWQFRFFNHLAWATEVVAALLMSYPPTRFVGGGLILVSFVFIATQIRLGFLCEMVIVCCLMFAHPGSLADLWLSAALMPSAQGVTTVAPPFVQSLLTAGLWMYLVLLPLARAGLSYNLYARRALPGVLQRGLESYTNLFGLIEWRVFTADVTDFFIDIDEQHADGSRHRVSTWGAGLRYRQVAESITVTTLFTTLRYYPSNTALFRERLLRYARTVPHRSDSLLVFRYLSVVKRGDRFDQVGAAEFVVDVSRGVVDERVLDGSMSVRAPAAASPIHEAVRPGSYAPARR